MERTSAAICAVTIALLLLWVPPPHGIGTPPHPFADSAAPTSSGSNGGFPRIPELPGEGPGSENAELAPTGGVPSTDVSRSDLEGPGISGGDVAGPSLLQIVVAPNECGPIWVGGAVVFSGATVPLELGVSQTLAAPACLIAGHDGYPAFGFHQWLAEGSISLSNLTSWTSSFVGFGNGTITAVYAPVAPVTWDIIPGTAGIVTVNRTWEESNGSTSVLPLGEYTVHWVPNPDARGTSGVGLHWLTFGAVSLSANLLTVGGPGTVVVEFEAPADSRPTAGTGESSPPWLYGLLIAGVLLPALAIWFLSPRTAGPVKPSDGLPHQVDWGLGEAPARPPRPNSKYR